MIIDVSMYVYFSDTFVNKRQSTHDKCVSVKRRVLLLSKG